MNLTVKKKKRINTIKKEKLTADQKKIIFENATNKLTQEIIQWVKDRGGYAKRINVVGIRNRKSTIGHPDIDCICEGKAFKVEIKKNAKEKLNPAQEEFKKEYEAAGGKVFIAYDFNLFAKELFLFMETYYSDTKEWSIAGLEKRLRK